MDWTPKTIEAEVLRILEQGAAAARRVVDGYLAQRTPERDAHWICTQMAKEFGAIAMHTDRVKGAIMQGRPAREIDEMVDTVKEEVAHYQGYRMVLERLVGELMENLENAPPRMTPAPALEDRTARGLQ